MPDPLALILLFWSLHQPQRVHIGSAFCCGIIMDILRGLSLGAHPLAYSVLVGLTAALHQRLFDAGKLVGAGLIISILLASKICIFFLEFYLKKVNFQYFLFSVLLEWLLWPAVQGILFYVYKKSTDSIPNSHEDWV